MFFLRAAPAVMTAELMRDFGIGAASLGNLSAFYFYFYVAMQIPVGVLTNSWGPRKLLVCGAISAAARPVSLRLDQQLRLGLRRARDHRRIDRGGMAGRPETCGALVPQPPLRDALRPRALLRKPGRAVRASASADCGRVFRVARERPSARPP